LPAARQRNALRHWLRSAGRAAPDARHLTRLVEEVVAGGGEQPRVRIGPTLVRRYRNRLYLLDSEVPEPPEGTYPLAVGRTLELPARLGRLKLIGGAARGIDPDLVARGCEVRFRDGGERLAPENGRPSRRLKQLFQEAGVVPWMRGRIPLIYCGGRLAAVADLWLAADCARPGGVRPSWEGAPTLY
jgi:tRNA(Ile)-lysidine synthase